MKLKEANRADLPGKKSGSSESMRILREFWESGMECAEIELGDGESVPRTGNRLRSSARRTPGVKVVQRGNRLFMLREVADHA